MSWKRSKDGGMDFDTTTSRRYEKAKQKMFGGEEFDMTAFTSTQLIGETPHVPVPKRNVKERFNDYKRRRGLA